MAQTKISGLADGGTPDPADLLVFVDVSDTTMAPSGTDKRGTVSNLALAASQITTGTLAVARGGLGTGPVIGLVKGTGAAYVAAVAGTDYLAPGGDGSGLSGLSTSIVAEGSNLYYSDERVDDRVAALLVAGTNVTLTYNDIAGTLTIDAAGGGGGGTVTAVSVATANGFAGSVANPTTTPAITITTGVIGILKGNGTAVAAAMAGTDYLAPTGNGSGLIGLTTSIVAEGSNLYYTNARADARIAAAVGVSVQAFDATLASLAAFNTNGFIAQSAPDTFVARVIFGTNNRIVVVNGGGSVGNPTIDISTSYAGQATITTVGTITAGTWNGTTIASANGGTGQVSYTDGQLLIGNTATGGLSKATLTAGTNVTITNGNGTITIAATAGAGGYATVQDEGSGLTARTTLNFVGAGVTASDNAGSSRTDVTINATVSSVGLTVPAWLSVAGSPITTAGTLAVTATTGQAANSVLATPDGSTGALGVRLLVAADIPALAASKITSGTLPEARGGTNQSTYAIGDTLYASAANTLSILAGNLTTTRKFYRQTGSGASSAAPAWDTLVSGDIPDLSATYQPKDATLTALAAYNTNGVLCQTAADTFAGRTITGTTNQVTVTNGDGVAGNPTLALPQSIHTGATPQFVGVTGGSTPLKIDTQYGALNGATDGATVTFDLSVANLQTVTLGGNRTLALSNDQTGQRFTIVLVQDATGSRTVTWWSGIKWPAGTTPTLTTTASKADVFTFIKTGAGAYYGFLAGANL